MSFSRVGVAAFSYLLWRTLDLVGEHEFGETYIYIHIYIYICWRKSFLCGNPNLSHVAVPEALQRTTASARTTPEQTPQPPMVQGVCSLGGCLAFGALDFSLWDLMCISTRCKYCPFYFTSQVMETPGRNGAERQTKACLLQTQLFVTVWATWAICLKMRTSPGRRELRLRRASG